MIPDQTDDFEIKTVFSHIDMHIYKMNKFRFQYINKSRTFREIY